jgi:hypothetical protein
MDFHGSVSTSEVIVNIHDVVRELYGIAEDKHPGLAEIRDFRRLGVYAWVTNYHNLLSS